MVPEGWENSLLDSVAKRRSGHTPNKKSPEYWDGGIKWVSLADSAALDDGQIFETDKEISEEGLKNSSAVMLPKGTVVLSRDAGVGKSAVLGDDMAVSQHFIAWVCDEDSQLNNWFLYNWMQMKKPLFERMAVGSTIKTIGLPFFKKLRINHPPLPEQQKIADILSTWDDAIEKTEALLTNARTQKRALMQQLLTGKSRFPEFEGQPWKEVRLGDVTKVIVSNVDKKSKDGEHPVRLCNYTDVYKRDTINPTQDFMEATATDQQIKKFGLRVGDVIITKDSETADDIAMPTYVVETASDLVCGYHLAIIRAGAEADGRFLKYYFELPHTRYHFGTRANGAIRFGLTIDGIEGAKVLLPPIEEQRRIASVIERAEADIAAIAAGITKLRTEKKALMQQLLTGKRRVNVEDGYGI